MVKNNLHHRATEHTKNGKVFIEKAKGKTNKTKHHPGIRHTLCYNPLKPRTLEAYNPLINY